MKGDIVERNRDYIEGFAGKSDLRVGPHMILNALDESNQEIEALRGLLREARMGIALMSHEVIPEVDIPQANSLLSRIDDKLSEG